jgi:hypothetical protein
MEIFHPDLKCNAHDSSPPYMLHSGPTCYIFKSSDNNRGRHAKSTISTKRLAL